MIYGTHAARELHDVQITYCCAFNPTALLSDEPERTGAVRLSAEGTVKERPGSHDPTRQSKGICFHLTFHWM